MFFPPVATASSSYWAICFFNLNSRRWITSFHSFIFRIKRSTIKESHFFTCGQFHHDDVVSNHHLCCSELSFIKKSTTSFSFFMRLLVFIGTLLICIFLVEAPQYNSFVPALIKIFPFSYFINFLVPFLLSYPQLW